MMPTLINNHLSDSSITSQPLRRHSDPPWLWTVVCIGSVSIHLLVFWLMRSSNEFQAWFPRSNQSSIPIDIIEIASEPKSTIKHQSTTPKIKPQSSFSSSPKSPPTTPNNQNDGEIISKIHLTEQDKTQKPEVKKPEVRKIEVKKPEVRKIEVEKPEVRKIEVEKPEPEKTEVEKSRVRQQFYPTNLIPEATPEATPIIPDSELPWNRRQEVKLGKGTLLRQDIPTDSPTPTAEPSVNPNREPEASPTTNGGGAIATVSPLLKEEVSELIQQKQLITDALPDVLAEYKGSTEKDLEASILPSDEDLKPANILASLVIDKNGKFQQAIIITIEPAALRSQANIYEQALNQIFAQESFLAAYNQDGSKPDLSNLYIRLKIKSINSP
ncbi:MAG: hypothetical protein HEQ13_23830 [Dolichospermum sp. DEX189]|jgi:hypothetical protein|uniref:TonB C-terminal domain-containing protein n=1 Tax=Aphanizomenon flos-aquae FACHB-1040 TaxID=2692887 RepID=A0ABR8BQ48_APHFL|nr:hypothetical protein [Aphanizomenon flos-aquae]MBD2277048.1 hypothetical protein [Aphanizomenon flos-aquae FACHB-1040]MBO1072198.1 hypothetical protein [Dolichospermum sp. DEX189]